MNITQTRTPPKQLVKELSNYMTAAEQKELLNDKVTYADVRIALDVLRRAEKANLSADHVAKANRLVDLILEAEPTVSGEKAVFGERIKGARESTNVEDRRFEKPR